MVGGGNGEKWPKDTENKLVTTSGERKRERGKIGVQSTIYKISELAKRIYFTA